MVSRKIVTDLVDLVIDAVNLRHVDRSTISAETQLGKDGLGLDSVDILEVVVNVESQYGFRITDQAVGEQVFRSIGTIAAYVEQHASSTH